MKNAALIPAYNEEKNILDVIKKTKKLRNFNKIIVVDDGSTDRTTILAKKAGVTILKHEKNKGKGEAIKTGFNYIKKNKSIKNVIIIDADLQYDPKECIKLLENLKNNDFVIGYRNFSKIPFRHKLGNFIWKNSFNVLFGTKLKDTNCGLIGLTRKAVEKMNVHGGYIVENSMLVSAVKNKLRIGQVPVDVKYKKISGIWRGIKVETGVLVFILIEGFKYRIGF